MKIVGEQLESWAQSASDNHCKDLFARSAFNRYYYAAFLITREMLGEFKPEWKHTQHKGIPEHLENAIKKHVLPQLKIHVQKGVISASEMQRLRQELQIATSALANLLKEAYDVRITADYEPEIAIESNGNLILLNSYKLNSAGSWANRASSHCKTIRKVWKDAGLA